MLKPLTNMEQSEAQQADLRRVGLNPNFWYPVARSRDVRKGRTFGTRFAGEPMALYRGESGAVYALEDRCAHRQVPLSMGVVEGDSLRCCYHAWRYRGDGKITQIPYAAKGTIAEGVRPPSHVGGYPCREEYGLIFVFPGNPELAALTAFPDVPVWSSPRHKTMYFSRTVRCHYSFMHENLLDMNHQFLHRGIVGKIKPTMLGYESDDTSVEARYLFSFGGGKKNGGARLLAPISDSDDVVTIRTAYPYQTLRLVPEGEKLPVFELWVAYVPWDREQRRNRVFGMLMIPTPRIRGLMLPVWPLIRRFTESVFAEDRRAVEAEQRAWDLQGADWNREIFPLILDVRRVLQNNGVPISYATSVSSHRD